jgi:UDP-N-acetylglucosamine--dolichyl-phosphate N-acetylglucosaminephosphotransferase
MPYLIQYLKRVGLVVKDQNKKGKPLVPISGGLAVMAGVFIGLSTYIFIRSFFYNDQALLVDFFAAITTILLITLVGYIDDSIIPSNKEASSGLKQWQKPLLTLVAAIPLIAIKAGVTSMSLPFIGVINFGYLYPLVLVPIIVLIAANMVNLLAGFNGLEGGLGLVYMGMLGLYAYTHQSYVAAVIALVTLAALLAYMKFNWVPAKILPGDSLTYLLGGALACIAILGNMEKAVGIVAIPFAIEFFLKARSRFKAKTFGFYKDGKISSLHGQEVYSIPHLMTRTGKFTEKQIVIILIVFELIISSLIWVI